MNQVRIDLKINQLVFKMDSIKKITETKKNAKLKKLSLAS